MDSMETLDSVEQDATDWELEPAGVAAVVLAWVLIC